ncbi:MAG TPA: hypothetical protein VER08_11945 [Pyrinomonadaceae bacterium]|nr:hypothetical protein [Pyrinomonadaceae bacterium]
MSTPTNAEKLVQHINNFLHPALNTTLLLLRDVAQNKDAQEVAKNKGEQLKKAAQAMKEFFEAVESDDWKNKSKIDKKLGDTLAAIPSDPGGFLPGIQIDAATASALPVLPAAPPAPPAPDKVEPAVSGGDGSRDSADPARRGDIIELGEFFESVSTSLMDAQEELNRRSLEYVSRLDPRFQPAYYGIPSVKAEMKVGFSTSRQKGVNLILFSNTQQKSEYGESTVSFEVVGAPPPPGPAVYGNYVVPVPRFLVVGERRERILDEVAARKKITGDTYDKWRGHALVLRFEPAGADARERYLVLWPGLRADMEPPNWMQIKAVYAVARADADAAPGETLDFPAAADYSIFDPVTDDQVLTGAPSTVPSIANVITQSLGSLDAAVSELKAATKANDATRVKAAEDKINQITKQASEQAGGIGKILVQLGDVVSNVNLILYQWLEAMTYRPRAGGPTDAGK